MAHAHALFNTATNECVCLDCGEIIVELGPPPTNALSLSQLMGYLRGDSLPPKIRRALLDRAFLTQQATERHICGIFQ